MKEEAANPDPLTSGLLGPPRDPPRTAVGVMSPPPPPPPRGHRSRISRRFRLSSWQAISLAASGTTFVGCGLWVAVALSSVVGVVLGSVVVVLGGAQWLIVARQLGRDPDELDYRRVERVA